jgi:hypothetical protein
MFIVRQLCGGQTPPFDYIFTLNYIDSAGLPQQVEIAEVVTTGASPPAGMTVVEHTPAINTEYWLVNQAALQYLAQAQSIVIQSYALQAIDYPAPFTSTQEFALPENVTWTQGRAGSPDTPSYYFASSTTPTYWLQLATTGSGESVRAVGWWNTSGTNMNPSGTLDIQSTGPGGDDSYYGVVQNVPR